MKKLDTKYMIVLLILISAVLAIVCSIKFLSDRSETKSGPTSYIVTKDYVWDMGTKEQKQIQILYDKKEKQYWKKEENGTESLLTGYEGSQKEAVEFSFAEKSDKTLLKNCDVGTTNIYRGSMKEASECYAYLLDQGYRNRYTIRDGSSVDIYLEKEDKYYRFLVIPEAGQKTCTVTFAEIWDKTWNTVLERGVE